MTKSKKPPNSVVIQQEARRGNDDQHRYGAISVNGTWFTSDVPKCASDVFSINGAMEAIVEAFKQ